MLQLIAQNISMCVVGANPVCGENESVKEPLTLRLLCVAGERHEGAVERAQATSGGAAATAGQAGRRVGSVADEDRRGGRR